MLATLTGGLKQLSEKRRVTVIRARATFESSQTLKLEAVDGKPLADDRVTFEHCIVATGSSPTRIPAFDLPTPQVMDSSGALELPDVPESLLVVGGGYIGLEMGTVYAALGSKVSVVEVTDGLLPGVDRDLVRPLHKRLQGQFEAIYLNAKVVSLADQNEAIEVTFEGDLPQKVRRFSRVLLSVGRRPNSAGLGLEKTKVEIDGQGFLVVDPQPARPIRTFWPSATSPASRCWRTRQAMRARSRSRRSWGNRSRSSRGQFRPSCLPIPKLLGQDLRRTRPKARAARSTWPNSLGPPAGELRPSAAPKE